MRVLAGLLVMCSACVPPPTPPAPAMPSEDGGCAVGTPVIVPELVNGRDLGGLVGTADVPLQCGQLFRSAAPSRLTQAGCTQFAELGIRTVVDLRVATERQGVPNSTCLDATATTLAAPLPIPYNVSPADYLADLHTDASVLALFAKLGDEASYPVLFHCTYGRDRSGVAAALVLGVLGVSRAQIREDYQRTVLAGLSTTPGSLDAVLDALEQAGGAEAYLLSIGVTDAQLATLKKKLLQPPQP